MCQGHIHLLLLGHFTVFGISNRTLYSWNSFRKPLSIYFFASSKCPFRLFVSLFLLVPRLYTTTNSSFQFVFSDCSNASPCFNTVESQQVHHPSPRIPHTTLYFYIFSSFSVSIRVSNITNLLHYTVHYISNINININSFISFKFILIDTHPDCTSITAPLTINASEKVPSSWISSQMNWRFL